MSEKNERGFRESPADAIAEAQSFEELFAVIDQIGQVSGVGSDKTYSAGDLRTVIQGVRDGSWDLVTVASTHGIQAKVDELLKKDKPKRRKKL